MQTHGPVDLDEPALQPQQVLNMGGQSQAPLEPQRVLPASALVERQQANTWS